MEVILTFLLKNSALAIWAVRQLFSLFSVSVICHDQYLGNIIVICNASFGNQDIERSERATFYLSYHICNANYINFTTEA